MAQEINGQQVEIETINSISVGAANDGWDVTQGTKSDVPASASTLGTTPATPYSVVALLKALVSGQASGSGGGAVTIASGSDATEGALGDAPLAAAASTANSTVNAALKGIFNLLFNGTARAGLVAGTAIVGKFGIDQTTPGTTNAVQVTNATFGATIAAGADATEGNTTDAPLTAAASATASTISSAMKGLFNLFFLGTAKVTVQTALARNSTSIASGLNANSPAAAPSLDTGAATGTPSPYATYKITVAPNQAGTATCQASNDNTTWYSTSAPIACAANQVTTATFPIFGRYVRTLWTNGNTATTAAATIFEQLSAV